MNIAIIGAGNMGGAVARGLNRNGSHDITVSSAHWEKLGKLKEECPEIRVMTDNRTAAAEAELVILAVKPWQIKGVINEVKDLLTDDKYLVSFAAGVTLASLREMLSDSTLKNLFYVIPNIAAEFCESMTFVCAEEGVEKECTEVVEKLFEDIGSVSVCHEKLMTPGMLMASCGIAYVMRFLRAQTEAGVEMGFYPKDALKIAIQTMEGAAELLDQTGGHPEEFIDRVTTPGGYTIRGLNEMDHAGFNSAVIKAFKTGL